MLWPYHPLPVTVSDNASTKVGWQIFHSPRGKSPEKVSANKGNVYSLIRAVTRNINDLSHILQDISGFRILYKRRISVHLYVTAQRYSIIIAKIHNRFYRPRKFLAIVSFTKKA